MNELYEVNGLGMAWSARYGGRFMRPTADRNGYLYVNLTGLAGSRRWYIHQLETAEGLHWPSPRGTADLPQQRQQD